EAVESLRLTDEFLEGIGDDVAEAFHMLADGAKYNEIGKAVGWLQGTVKSKLSRTRGLLREWRQEFRLGERGSGPLGILAAGALTGVLLAGMHGRAVVFMMSGVFAMAFMGGFLDGLTSLENSSADFLKRVKSLIRRLMKGLPRQDVEDIAQNVVVQ